MVSTSAGVAVTRGSYTLDEVVSLHRQHWHTAKSKFREISGFYKVDGAIIPAVGVYKGNLEPAYLLQLRGEIDDMFGVCAEWGLCHDQEVVRVVQQMGRNTGNGLRYTFRLGKEFSGRFNILVERCREWELSFSIFTLNPHFGGQVTLESWVKCSDKQEVVTLVRIVASLIDAGIHIGLSELDSWRDCEVLDMSEGEYEQYLGEREVSLGSCLDAYT